MSDAVTLSLAEPPIHTLIADCIAGDRFGELEAKAIAHLPVVHGGRPATLGEFFKVRGGPSSVVRMLAGTVVVCGTAGPGAGRFRRRGSIGALVPIDRPATFRYACTYCPPHVGLLLRYLRDRAGVPVADRYVVGKYERHSGDLAELGKGEILRWVGE